MKRETLMVEDPTNHAVIDNIGSFPFLLEAHWDKGKLYVVVTQPGCDHPYPKHEFEVPLLPKDPEQWKDG